MNIFTIGNGYAYTADNVPRPFKPNLVPPMKQQEVTLLLMIPSNETEPTTRSWSNVKVFMSWTHARLVPAKNRERNNTGDSTPALCVWKHRLHWCDGPRYAGLRARLHCRFSTKHPEHPRESGCSYPVMGPSPNHNALHTFAAGRSTNLLPAPPC